MDFKIKNDKNMSPERWEEILQCKQLFLQNSVEDLSNFPQISPELLESWIRSRNLNVDAYTQITRRKLSKKEYAKILKENQLLVEIANPIGKKYRDMVGSSENLLELVDPNGVSLLHHGDYGFLPPVATEGDIFNEDTMGTNAHTMSKLLKRPIQLVGPEHYCVALQNTVASSAPIFNEDGEVIACLVLTQPVDDPPWEESFESMLLQTLGLITSMAAAIESQIQLYKSNANLSISNDLLRTSNDTLEATLASVDEGIITIDNNGHIIRLNQEGARIFKQNVEELVGKNISEYLDSQSRLMDVVSKGENASNIEEIISVGKDEQPYVINIRAVLNQNNKQLNAAVLRLNHAEKINTMVTSRSGNTASFHFEDIVGESKVVKKVIDLGRRFANTPENILLIGESGTGKELFAQAIHNQYRPQGPFMAVNCAAMPRSLIESELFGYEGGSFTGAERNGRPGKIELAHGGTIFLDEIGDMPLELQAVLLRVLEDKEVTRIGGRRSKKVDFRVIAATNRDLHEMVKDKTFREDLFFRLSVLPITLPPLRNRERDAEVLSRYFIQNYCNKMGWKTPTLSLDAQKIINNYEWPGNVRQLENVMYYAINTSEGDVIDVENLPDSIIIESSSVRFTENANNGIKIEETLSIKKLEKSAIDLALLQSHNSIPRAAGLLGMSKATLYRKIKEYNEQQ